MKKTILWAALALFVPALLRAGEKPTRHTFDVVVYGGTSSGVIAACAAAREGAKVALLEETRHLGGMTSSGLGNVDKGKETTIGGYAREFFIRVGDHYGMGGKPCWKMEPSVAENTFVAMAKEAGVQIFYGARLLEKKGVECKGGKIRRIVMENGDSFTAPVFIDATYEGDLMAWAGVSYTVGRESMKEYGEPGAGVRIRTDLPVRKVGAKRITQMKEEYRNFPYDYYFGEAGEAGEADNKVQAYCFRLTLTNRPENRVPFTKPDNYDPVRYKGTLDRVLKTNVTRLDGVYTFYHMPNGKTDINHMDLSNVSWGYPDGSYAERQKIWQYHKDYQMGALWFFTHDPRVPEALRREASTWGFAKDEFADNGHWPRTLYIREGRRMKGAYVMRQQDAWENATKEDAVGMGSYFMDCHNVQRTITPDGRLIVEGNMGIPVEGVQGKFSHQPMKPYQIPYRSLTPKEEECGNLLVTICLSASHVIYGSLRMEPVYMIAGHAAGVAAAQAVREKTAVQRIDVPGLQARLKAQGQVFEYTDPKKK